MAEVENWRIEVVRREMERKRQQLAESLENLERKDSGEAYAYHSGQVRAMLEGLLSTLDVYLPAELIQLREPMIS